MWDMNVDVINPFILSTRELFDKLVKVPLSFGKPQLRSTEDQTHRLYPITTGITLSGAVSGMILICFAEAVAIAIAANLAKASFNSFNDDCQTALTEAVSMIASGAKSRVPDGLTTLSVPKVMATAEVTYPPGLTFIVIPCETSIGRFLIEIGFKANEKAA